jgi:hypothetical protein
MTDPSDLTQGMICLAHGLPRPWPAVAGSRGPPARLAFRVVFYGVRMNVRTNLLLPQELVADVDRVAGPRGRSRYVADAVRARLRRDRLTPAFEQAFGALDRSAHPEWARPGDVVAWVRSQRAQETDPGPVEDR